MPPTSTAFLGFDSSSEASGSDGARPRGASASPRSQSQGQSGVALD